MTRRKMTPEDYAAYARAQGYVSGRELLARKGKTDEEIAEIERRCRDELDFLERHRVALVLQGLAGPERKVGRA